MVINVGWGCVCMGVSCTSFLVFIIGLTKFPSVELKEDEKVGALQTHLDLLKKLQKAST